MKRAPARLGGPLDQVNDAFRDAYGEARKEAERGAPVFILLADALLVFRRGTRRELPLSRRAYHLIKSVAHAPIALFAVLHRVTDRELDPATIARLDALRGHAEASLDAIAELTQAHVVSDLRLVLDETLGFLGRSLAARSTGKDDLEAFAGRIGPCLLRLTDHATRIDLETLHACVEEALAPLEEAERRALQVVVAGDHQARVRSLGMQYFQQRLCEPDGLEERVTYGEAVTDEAGALALVGTRRLDRAIAHAFFGDAKRLQRDVLGDAGRARLDELDLPPIE